MKTHTTGDAMSAYTGKSLHVAVSQSPIGDQYSIWTNDGDEPIARCIDAGAAHFLVASQSLAEALRNIRDMEGTHAGWYYQSMAAEALTKAGL